MRPLAESFLEPGRPGLLCLAVIAHNNPKRLMLQFLCDNIKWNFGRACMLIIADEEYHYFKRGEKEKVRRKIFSLCLEGCKDSVFPIAPEISGELHVLNPNIGAGSCMLTWSLMRPVCLNAP